MPPLPQPERPLVGRTAELDELMALVEDGGAPSAMLLGGHAGVGKTRLLTELADRASVLGARVLLGHGLAFGDSRVRPGGRRPARRGRPVPAGRAPRDPRASRPRRPRDPGGGRSSLPATRTAHSTWRPKHSGGTTAHCPSAPASSRR